MLKPTRARRSALLLGAVATSATALVATTLGLPAQAAAPAAQAPAATATAKAGPLVKVKDRGDRAERALANATAAMTPAKTGSHRDATLALRRLWKLRDALSPADQAAADKLVARPDEPNVIETATLSIHYNAAELGYSINDAVNVLNTVSETYADSGYKRPLPDGNLGGNSKTDIYLTNLQPGLYGYCTTDQKRFKGRSRGVWSYCAIDADFAGFPRTPLENLQVTAAHEYFHATQFAYSFYMDDWFLEASAAWVEDEVYPSINDNLQYLADSPITKPRRSIDKFGGVFQYGVWNYLRYLTEHYPARTGALPDLILKAIKAQDTTKGANRAVNSLQAINKALKKAGKTTMAEQFALYSAATRSPAQTFAEGAALGYPAKPLRGGIALGPAKKKKAFSTKLDHLTSDTYQFVPSGTAADSTLKVKIKMGRKPTGSRAVAVIYNPAGLIIDVKALKVNGKGVAKKKLAFGAGAVGAVEITLVNASLRMKGCNPLSKSPYTCGGRPVDQNVKAVLRAKAS
ncbi:MXAN_6640 family putative metalloprotease [Nocardioides flavescens]|uniref:Neutral metalloprotease n=1 Tax=Nocardioides flavescens TaxID=2691959 RepID=A0A6L7F3T2_9ACTN|nr:MXAN_6640 family putative metalloprotease [Nocardioides flavescens]MXG91909.1 hypothetical protein [Nocardioides flavescens]